MSHQATAWVAERSRAKGSELLVLYIIANHAHPDGTGSWPSLKTIASEAKMSSRGVQYVIERLEGLGDIVVERSKSGGDTWTGRNEYILPGVTRDGFYQAKQDQQDEPDANFAPESRTQATRTPDEEQAQAARKNSANELEVELEGENKYEGDSPTQNIEAVAASVYSDCRKLFRRKVGKSIAKPRGIYAERWMEAVARHGGDTVLKAFEIWLETDVKKDFIKKSSFPLAIFMSDLSGWIEDAQTAIETPEAKKSWEEKMPLA